MIPSLIHWIKLILHLNPTSVDALARSMGPWLYVLLFAIICCETGLVVTPFLPGDSLLFAVGAVTGMQNSSLHILPIGIMLCVAANLGDLINYSIGKKVGPAIFSRDTKLLNKKHLMEAHQFYERHGRKTIILARFVPIIRTFAPFVAGIGDMPFSRFIGFSVAGGALWVWLCLCAGAAFGSQKFVQDNFQLVVVVIVVISVLPAAYHWWAARRVGTAPIPTAQQLSSEVRE
ncbi:MAG TPA: VTT domain-containing protein [Tepidisphaeraceae bacterium]|jgi:membrane-associated protein|nr:VTT domain-containing protein [Tepidisphaeraceae bacterium]